MERTAHGSCMEFDEFANSYVNSQETTTTIKGIDTTNISQSRLGSPSLFFSFIYFF